MRKALLAALLAALLSSGCYAPRGTHWTSVGKVDGLGDALAEGDAPDATTRDWERCAALIRTRTGDVVLVVCKDGHVERF